MAYSKKDQKTVRNAYRKAVQKIFGVSKELAEQSIYLPEDDMGEWAPNSLSVVNFEHGLPNPSYEAFDGWYDVSELATEIAGENNPSFMETINGAMGAIYR